MLPRLGWGPGAASISTTGATRDVHHGLLPPTVPDVVLARSSFTPLSQPAVPPSSSTTGLHPDYHTERDQPDTLNYAKMARIVRMVHQLSWNLAQNSGRPIYSGP